MALLLMRGFFISSLNGDRVQQF